MTGIITGDRFILARKMEMSDRDKSKQPTTTSLDENCSERGLRILGRIIARRLAARDRDNEIKARSNKIDSPTSMDNP